MIEKGFAERFASDWVAAWNSHDLDRILAHYKDDFEMSSPLIALVGQASGRLRGKAAVGAYWAKALQRIQNLHFELVTALAGVDSVTLYYKGHSPGKFCISVHPAKCEQPLPITHWGRSNAPSSRQA
ncbi:MAG: nuclear transport factor 2 family protein [Acidobacteriales bacterium]|nr:nuclear transport factor 2 family protein [Terriglobales bacterium]